MAKLKLKTVDNVDVELDYPVLPVSEPGSWKIFKDGVWRPPTPRELFEQITFLGENELLVKALSRYLIDRNHIPFIDYDAEIGGWWFHSMQCADFTMSKKPDIAAHFSAIPKKQQRIWQTLPREITLEDEVVLSLIAQGVEPRRQVKCSAGWADIVTPDSVYEIERYLTRKKIYEAVGQVTLYQKAINPSARMIIVSYRTPEAEKLTPIVQSLGIEVLLWEQR
jgi:hypothetical protein